VLPRAVGAVSAFGPGHDGPAFRPVGGDDGLTQEVKIQSRTFASWYDTAGDEAGSGRGGRAVAGAGGRVSWNCCSICTDATFAL